jgi:Zn finger protein HypA/HybF involved in hydrogenase expression
MRKDIMNKKEDILKWINENKPKNYMCLELKCKPSTLNYWLKEMGIEYKGIQNWSNGKKFPEKWIHSSEYLKNGTIIHSERLKQKLFRDGIKTRECEKCGIKKWNKIDAPLELHHINGDRHNNELSNLQILCPNCHAQTSNFGTKNIKEETLKNIKKQYFCECGKEIKKSSKRCPECDKINQRKVKERPIKEELVKMIKNSSLEAVGRKYGVSGNAVKKWLK